ncbi:hypothetical protein [Paenibacillus thalictri]|uniref:Uncharacterized protein n=1 Tax=Paenibacillus thalictri TaxID=2527873 RepID=A0A4Q9DWT1_9BACL|nr:hypothetical protein [Paenibacillus thalictri]TBL80292.1 hypothetical protein EYB31_07695 [Paenibacillus thalictri]
MQQMRLHRLLLTFLVAGAAAFGQPAAISAEGGHYAKDDVAVTQALPAVPLGGGSYMELKRAAILPGDAGKTLVFTLTAVNGGDRDIALADYWVRPYSASGAQFKAELLPQDKDKNMVPEGNSTDLTFYAIVNEMTELSDVNLRVVQWDYSLADLERKIGDIRLQTDDLSYLHPAGTARTMQLGNVPLKGEVTRVSVKKNEKYYAPQLALQLVNEGATSLTPPQLQYSIRTADGSMYPLELVNTEKIILQPKVMKELQLKSSTIPLSAGSEAWELVVTQTLPASGDTKINVPLGFMPIPETDTGPLTQGIAYDYANATGLYSFKLEQLERLPWDEQDLLTAQLAIANRDESGLPIPDFRAYFLLDDGVKIEAKAVKADKQIGIPKGQEARFKLIGKIPYTYQYGEAKLLIEDKTAEGVYPVVGEFQLPAQISGLPAVAFGVKRSPGGRSLQYSPRAVNSYADRSSKLYEVQVEVANADQRGANIPKLAAYLQTPANALYPMKMREVKTKLNPDGRALVSFWTKLPKEMDSSGLKLLLGDAVTDNHATADGEKPDAFMDAAVYDLPNENVNVAGDLRDIDMYPYSLSIWHISTWLDAKEIRINFQYDLSKDSYYETNTEGEKIVLQLEDLKGNITQTQKIFFEKGIEDDDVYFQLGEHSYKWKTADQDLIFKTETLKQYKLSVYHEFQGQRKLLASKTIDWFTTTD